MTDREAELLSRLDPERIHVENVRSILDVSYAEALKIVEAAVRQGVFERRVDVICPDGSVAASAETEDKLPATVSCWSEDEGFSEELTVPTQSLPRTISYRLHESSHPYKKTA
jgi:hypothetical protein